MSEEKTAYGTPAYVLTEGQRRLVVMLAQQRQALIAEANRQIAVLNETERDLVEMIRQIAGLPAERSYKFIGDEREVRLVETVDGRQ